MRFKQVLKKYWEVALLKKWQWIMAFLLYGFGTALFSIVEPFFLKWVIDFLNSNVAGSEAVWIELMKIFGLVVLNMLVYNFCFRLADYLLVYLEAEGMRELNNVAFKSLQKHSYSFFSDEFVGSLVAKAKRFSYSFETVADQIVFKFWLDGIKVVGVFGVLLYIDVWAGGLFMGWTVIYFCLSYFLLKWKTPADIDESKADSKVTAHLADTLTNILNVKIFAKTKVEKKTFEGITKLQFNKRLAAWRRANVQWLVNGFMMMMLTVGGLFYSLYMWNLSVFTVGTVVLLQTYFAQINMRLWELGRAMMMFSKAIAYGYEMIEIINTPEGIADVPNPEKCRINKGEIEFKDVCFGYGEAGEVFSKFNLKIRDGEKIGLVGHSGSGKSTLTKLLMRFVDVNSGEVLIDGQNIAKIKKDDLRENISFVPQDPVLFHRSLRENIAYADLSASEDAIEDVAKKAHAYEFIEQLPERFETFVGERGVKLSGGERQRVAIARAMLEDAPIVVLDEATSSLDSVSEVLIQKALEELLKTKTAIVIAHRLSTIKQMDRILVMDGGEIIEQGTHDELLEKDGAYAELWKHQTGEFID